MAVDSGCLSVGISPIDLGCVVCGVVVRPAVWIVWSAGWVVGRRSVRTGGPSGGNEHGSGVGGDDMACAGGANLL